MRFFATALFICGVVASTAPTASGQASSGHTPTVPHKIHFAGMTLTITDEAREEIQKDVDMLTKSPKYFEVKAERARTYFPIIERIFAEERVPDDFKFLALQESALIADAVSVSDAVGFWQFKDYTAREVGMRVDNEVDERMNIVSSTHGAAKYIKQANFMFNNWVYALQSYQMGAGGVRRAVGDEINGSRHMDITADTYWYVKKFLAHKVAFQDAVESEPKIKVTEIVLSQENVASAGASLQTMSSSMSIDAAGLREFNKWIRTDMLPNDKPYTLIVPSGSGVDFSTLYTASNPPPTSTSKEVVKTENEILINDVPVVQAKAGETMMALADRAGLSLSHFMKYNDLDENHKVTPGGYYFKARKKSKTEQDFHKVKPGETLWQISQLYGLQIKRLRKYNHLDSDRLPAGEMVWLNSNKPKEGALVDEDEPTVELMEDRTFDWGTSANNNVQVSIQTPGESKNTSIPLNADTHIVQAGETLYSISRQYDVSVGDLKLMNNIGSETELKPGQVLKLTVNEEVAEATQATDPVSATETFHEVKLSDTLYSVARQYGVTIKDLMECNNKKDFSVSLGERLKIPSK